MSGVLLAAVLVLPVATGSTASSVALAGPAQSGPAWEWPLAPPPDVVNVFDAPDGPYASGHRGADLLGSAGQPVLAVDDGTVAYAGKVAGIGVVSIDTSSGRVTYQPVLATVRRGEDVGPGTVLGRLTTTGGHCLPQVCLHLGLVVAGSYLDPLPLLGGGAVRLLPVDGPLDPVPDRTPPPADAALGPPRPIAVDSLAVGTGLRLGRLLGLGHR